MPSASFHLRYEVCSDRGPVRGDNQDAAYADRRILALADGMGGHPAGDVAASLAIKPFSRIHPGSTSWDVVDLLRAAALSGDDAIAAHVSANPDLDGMGTTLTAVLPARVAMAVTVAPTRLAMLVAVAPASDAMLAAVAPESAS